ncbi:MAG: DUF5686 family protein [Clostridium sp.]|nr:DUF5686 family protein [Clostridium sp.]
MHHKKDCLPSDKVDSILSQLYALAPAYAARVSEFHADLYTKAHLNIERKNILFRYIPALLRGERGVKDYILESHSDVHYTAPNIYDQKISILSGTLRNEKSIPGLMNYFNINIYSPYLLGDNLLSPLCREGRKYYLYTMDYISQDSLNRRVFHISFRPRNKSFQLVKGNFVITDSVWTVRRFHFMGRQEQLTFDCQMEMGAAGTEEETLPLRYDLKLRFAFLRNKVNGDYATVIRYKEVDFQTDYGKKRRNRNLTASFSLTCDTKHYQRVDMMPDSLRWTPLYPNEQRLYLNKMSEMDTLKTPTNKELKRKQRRDRLERAGAFLIEDYKWRLTDKGTLRSMALLNPMLFSFSASNGIAYRNDLKLRSRLPGDRSIGAKSRLGYNFKQKLFYWNLNGDLAYWPSRNGTISFAAGNGNRIYSSDVLDDLKSIPDSTFDFNKLNLELFNDLYISINHGVEVCNGLRLDIGLNVHRRTPVNKPELYSTPEGDNRLDQMLEKHIHNKYISFAPRLRITWTPQQYYYMNGKQKVNLGTRFPVVITDYERGLRGLFDSSIVYERMELDIQHKIRLGVTRNLFYRLGFGLFTNQEQTYFVDFENFRSNNLPLNWNDDIGGVFQALDSRWYNASNHYVRAHLVYESPFLVLRHLMKYSGYVQNERLYLNVLSMPHLRPYIELGYGIGTHVFDMGLFVSSRNYSNIGFGWKFTFELFSK